MLRASSLGCAREKWGFSRIGEHRFRRPSGGPPAYLSPPHSGGILGFQKKSPKGPLWRQMPLMVTVTMRGIWRQRGFWRVLPGVTGWDLGEGSGVPWGGVGGGFGGGLGRGLGGEGHSIYINSRSTAPAAVTGKIRRPLLARGDKAVRVVCFLSVRFRKTSYVHASCSLLGPHSTHS